MRRDLVGLRGRSRHHLTADTRWRKDDKAILGKVRSPRTGGQSTSVVAESAAQCLQSQKFKTDQRVGRRKHMNASVPALLPSTGLLLHP